MAAAAVQEDLEQVLDYPLQRELNTRSRWVREVLAGRKEAKIPV
jgi:hypothetical protein